MNIYNVLNNLNINYDKVEPKAVYTVNEAKQFVPYIKGIGSKNLFIKDNNNYYLYVLKDDERADFKQLQSFIYSNKLSFASEDELFHIIKLKAGSVTPLGIINDDKHEVIVILDKSLNDNLLLVHPNINTSTINISYNDLIKFIKYCGNKYIEYEDGELSFFY